MLKDLQGEWERAADDARAPGNDATRAMVLARLDAVAAAFRSVAEGAISRVALADAVKDALGSVPPEDAPWARGALEAAARDAETRAELAGVERRVAALEEMMAEVVKGSAAVLDAIGKLQTTLGAKVGDVAERVTKIDARLRMVGEGVDTSRAHGATADAIAELASAARRDAAEMATRAERIEARVDGAIERLAGQVHDLQGQVGASIARWESGRATARRKLLALRDALHEQLLVTEQRSEAGSTDFWGKLVGRAEGALQLGPEEWAQVRGRFETIVEGLEALFAAL